MTKLKRIINITTSIFMILFGMLLIASPNDTYVLVILVLSLTFALIGLKDLIYYFTMARFMVNGRLILFKGVILLDFGLVSASLIDMPKIYLILYLVVIHAFSGVVEILRAKESKNYGSSWKLKLSHGIVNILLALCCMVFIKKTNIAIYIYAAGLIYSAAIRIITALRKTALIYIQ